MGHGIGPQSLGASGQNPKSKPCGTPLDFNEGFESLPESVQRKIDPEGKADSPGNYGSPLNSQMPGLGVGGGGMIGGISSLFNRATIRKRQLAGNRGGNSGAFGDGRATIAANAAANAASPGGGSAGMQADLEGLQTKLSDLKSQIDNLANTV
jgi:hypothetical protein